jgi:6-phosphogluconolactonase
MRISFEPKGARSEVVVEVGPTPQAVAELGAEFTAKLANERIAVAGQFAIALAGGSTPRLYHEALVRKYKDAIDWSKVHVFFSDDRAVPLTHKDSNFHMAEETLLSHVPIPSANVHRIEGDDGDNVRAAREYEQTIARLLGPDMAMDLVCLGMGEDGHTASLFPKGTAPKNGVGDTGQSYVIPTYAPPTSPVAHRVSFSYGAIAKAKNVLVMATGQAKASRLKEVLTAEGDLPMQRVARERAGHTLFILDTGAAQKLIEVKQGGKDS